MVVGEDELTQKVVITRGQIIAEGENYQLYTNGNIYQYEQVELKTEQWYKRFENVKHKKIRK